MNNYDKKNESLYIEYLDVNNLYGWGMSQKLSINGFKWVKQKKLPKFNGDFIKKYGEYSNARYFFELDVEYPKTLFDNHKDLPFLPERKRLKNSRNLFVVQKTKKNMLFT